MLLTEKPDLEFIGEEYHYLTPLQIACKEGASEAIFQLLKAGAKPNVVASEGHNTSSPLESLCNYAFRARSECFEAINALLNAGADPNLYSNDATQPENSKSALIWSVICGGNTLKLVEHLLEAGAKVGIKDGKGNDAVYYAKESKRDDLVKLLTFYKNKTVENKHSRKASLGKYRVVGYDQYDYRDYFIEEFENIDDAIHLLKERVAKPNGSPTSFSDVYFIYNDKEEALYKGTFDEGFEKLPSTR
jgi:ankyrin repeat protein